MLRLFRNWKNQVIATFCDKESVNRSCIVKFLTFNILIDTELKSILRLLNESVRSFEYLERYLKYLDI